MKAETTTKAVKKVAKKKVAKKVKSAADIAAEKQLKENKKIKRQMEADEKKRRAKAEQMKKRATEIEEKFAKFCKENKLTAIMFYGETKVGTHGVTVSDKIKNYEAEGLLAVQGYVRG